VVKLAPSKIVDADGHLLIAIKINSGMETDFAGAIDL
jgi:hypothetical protein